MLRPKEKIRQKVEKILAVKVRQCGSLIFSVECLAVKCTKVSKNKFLPKNIPNGSILIPLWGQKVISVIPTMHFFLLSPSNF